MNRKTALLAVLLIFLVWAGYVAIAVLTLEPSIEASWGNVSENSTEVLVHADLHRPLLVPASINSLRMNFSGVEVARLGYFKYSATGSSADLSMIISNDRLVRALINYMNNGQRGTVSVVMKGRALGVVPIDYSVRENMSEDILSRLNFTSESQDYLGGLLKTPAITSTKAEWGGERGNYVVITLHMTLYNPNSYSIPVSNMSFDLYVDGVKLGKGLTEKPVVLPAHGYTTITVDTFINEESLPKVLALHIKNGEKSTLRVSVSMRVNLAGNAYTLDIGSYEETLQTHILRDINGAFGG